MDENLHDALLSKGLTGLAASGGAWQDRDFNPILTDAAKKKRPILAYLNIKPANGNPHQFRRRDSLPYPHWEATNATPIQTQSGVSLQSRNLKICRSQGFVDNFLISTIGPDNFDVALAEVLGHVEGAAMQVSAAVLWGDAGLVSGTETSGNGNIYMPNGLDADTGIMRINGAGAALTDALFQKLLDTTNVAGMTGKRFAIMSSMMASRLEAVTQALGARYMVEEDGLYGRRIKKYRDTYILESDQTRPRAVMGTVSAAGSDPGTGGLSNGTYYYYVAPVTAEGEQLRQASEASVTLSGGTATQIVTLTVTAFQFSDTNAPYSDAVYYKIYRGTASNGEILVATVPALSYTSGTVTGADTTLVDDGTTDSRGGTTGNLPGGVSSADDELTGTVAAPEECIFLVNADPADGIEIAAAANKGAQNIGDNDLFGLVRLGKTTDNEPFLVGSYVAPIIKRGACHGVLRRVLAA